MGDPARDFAALMSGAAAAAAPAPPDAPYGYTRDRETGELRPKKVPGRPRARPPSVDELKAAREGDPGPGETGPQEPPAEDRAPDEKGRHRRAEAAEALDGGAGVPYVPGRIAKGMNKLYRRAGKIIKALDPVVGEALIEVTRKEDDDDVTVGDAWEELARVNPRVRRFLLKLISGGAWGQLAAAHAPILLAVLLKPAVLKHIPFGRLLAALADDDDGQADGDQTETPGQSLLDGLNGEDLQQMVGLAQRLAVSFGSRGAPPGPLDLQEAA
jgi:hypothetical protein